MIYAREMRYLVSCGCVEPLCALLICPDPSIVTVCLEGLENLLKGGEPQKDMAKPGDTYLEEDDDHVTPPGDVDLPGLGYEGANSAPAGKPKIEAYNKNLKKGDGAMITPAKTRVAVDNGECSSQRRLRSHAVSATTLATPRYSASALEREIVCWRLDQD
nr:hypothetical protein [Tanacetum cinerariifolium]